jgi:hypothetical protein
MARRQAATLRRTRPGRRDRKEQTAVPRTSLTRRRAVTEAAPAVARPLAVIGGDRIGGDNAVDVTFSPWSKREPRC